MGDGDEDAERLPPVSPAAGRPPVVRRHPWRGRLAHRPDRHRSAQVSESARMKINRRQFLRRSAVVAAGAAAVAVVGMPEGRPEPMAKWGASATDALIVGNEFDYLVSACWADEVAGGRGIEGHEFVQRGGRSFRVYS